MAQTNFQLGYSSTRREFRRGFRKELPGYLPAKLMKIQITLAGGDPKGAATLAGELLERLSKTAPDNDNSPTLLAEIREKTYLARGSAQLQLKNFAPARQDFEAARDTAPNDPSTYNSLASVSISEKKPDEAVGNWENALKVDSVNFAALNGLLTLYSQRQEFDKAHARIDQVLNSYPNNASLHYLKGLVYSSQRNAQATEAELRKAIELDANYVVAYNAR